MPKEVLNKTGKELTLDELKEKKAIGSGGYAKVYTVKKGKNNQVYALKEINKKKIIDESLVTQI